VVGIARDGTVTTIRPSLTTDLEPCVAEHISFGSAHGLLYRPTGAHALLVRVHGGPTAQASSALDLEVQFWTSRGFAVADVDYRGSTGYGRAFRDALYGQWGVVDVEDCVACAEHVGLPAVIRGSSSGGYTVLRALTTTDLFAAGVSRYGVADPLAPTHRFEARYARRLVAPDHGVDLARLSSPVILFQGLDDEVVPPAQAHALAAALEAKGLDHELHLFAGEGHGFRRAETRQAVLEAEHAFITRAIGFPAS
jgi:dipeptidyl aminopeptidase/acylaminoacyl peptidase